MLKPNNIDNYINRYMMFIIPIITVITLLTYNLEFKGEIIISSSPRNETIIITLLSIITLYGAKDELINIKECSVTEKVKKSKYYRNLLYAFDINLAIASVALTLSLFDMCKEESVVLATSAILETILLIINNIKIFKLIKKSE